MNNKLNKLNLKCDIVSVSDCVTKSVTVIICLSHFNPSVQSINVSKVNTIKCVLSQDLAISSKLKMIILTF